MFFASWLLPSSGKSSVLTLTSGSDLRERVGLRSHGRSGLTNFDLRDSCPYTSYDVTAFQSVPAKIYKGINAGFLMRGLRFSHHDTGTANASSRSEYLL